jgi:hypothetical protein
LVEQVARDIRIDYGVRDAESPPVKPIHCWRFPEGHCRKFPVYTPRKVTVLLAASARNDDIYERAIKPAIRQINMIPYRVDEQLLGAEEMCRGCENCQESDSVILSLDDWNLNNLFMAGLAYGIGRKVVLLKNESLQPVPLHEPLGHDVVNYAGVEELKQALIDQLAADLNREGSG